MRVRILFVWIVFFLFTAGHVCAQGELDDLWKKAREARDPEAAIGLYSKIIESSADAKKAYLARAKLFKKTKQFEKSIEDFNKYIELDPEEFLGYYAKGRVYTHMKRYDLAIRSMSMYIRKFPEDPKGYFERGYIKRYFSRKHASAIKDFSMVIKMSPEDSTAFIERGLSYMAVGDMPKGIKDFSEAINFTPENSIAYRERGRCYKEMEEDDKAISDFEKAVKFNPNYPWTYLFLSSIYYRTNELEKALDFIDEALSREKNEVMYDLKANILRDMGLFEKALQEIANAEEAGVTHDFTKGSIYFAKGDKKNAETNIMNAFIKNEEADLDTFNKLIMDRVEDFMPFVSSVKDTYIDRIRKYGSAGPAE